ncbi:MAG: hypothetical protein ACRD2P_03285 [Terriglobia bacterium]
MHDLVGAVAWAQDASQAASASQAGQPSHSEQSGPVGQSNLRVIVPWTHFKPSNAPAPTPATAEPPPQTSDPEIVSPQLSTSDLPADTANAQSAGSPPTNDASQAPANDATASQPGQANQASQAIQQAVPVVSNAESQQLYEEDISKKHPHPPEPVKLPPADQIAAPLSDSAVASSAVNLKSPGSQTEASGTKPGQTNTSGPSGSLVGVNNTPEAQIAALTAGYESRRQDREAKLKGLEASTANDPAAKANLEMQETRLALEGEQDRMQAGQQLSQQFALLAEELDKRAAQINGLIEDRKQTALAAQAGIDQMKDLLRRRQLALRNLAALPPSGDNNQMMEGLKTELTQDEATQKLDEERGQEAGGEVQALEAEAAELSQAAAKARQRSDAYAAVAQNAQANQDRLADRMEYDAARERAAGTLAGASKAIESAPALAGAETPAPSVAPAASGLRAPTAAPNPEVESLRECLHKTRNVDACLAQQGGS